MKKNYILPSLANAKTRTIESVQIERELFNLAPELLNLGVGRTYFLRTYGCQANERDGETIAGIMEKIGYHQASSVDEADVVILNTCAIRQNAEDKVFGEIGALKRLKMQNPDLIIGLCGCMAQEEAVVEKILTTYRQVDLIFGTHNIHRLPQLLQQAIMSKEKSIEVFSKEGEVIENLPSRRFLNHKAWVNIMYGCDKFCTYCIVPYTRGKERSRLIEDILEEVQSLKDAGYKEITLLGQNVNAYGKDLGYKNGFATLLNEVAKTNIERIRFTTSHPWDFTDEMVSAIKENKNIMPAIHLPVQSGNNAILKIMGRRYTVEEYLSIFHKLKKEINCSFSTDIIVGFPNETEEQFEDTLKLYDICQFDNAYTFVYSARVGTPAAKMQDTVSLEDKERRLQTLNEKVNAYALMNNQPYLGRIVKVLVDGTSKKNDQILSGYTETNKLVNFQAIDAKAGDIVDVEITACKTWSLDGKQVKAG